MGRGQNWTSKADVLLCTAWLHVSQGHVTGADQKASTFWNKIMDFIQKKNDQDFITTGVTVNRRSLKSSQSRFAAINTSVSTFVGVYSQQERYAASGTNDTNVERAALELYRNSTPGCKSFDFCECWMVLKQAPKWASPGIHAPEEGAVPAAGSPVDLPGAPTFSIPTQSHIRRPMGAKRTKLEIFRTNNVDRQLNAIAAANILANKRARILQQQVALSYFKLDASEVPIEMREVFLRTRTQLVNELDEESQGPVSNPQANNEQPPPNENLDADSPASVETGFESPGPNQRYGYGNENPDQHLGGNNGVEENFPATYAFQPEAGHGHLNYVPMSDFDLRIGI